MDALEELKMTLNGKKELVASKFKAQILGIFGSYARGTQKPGSDIDILVRFKDGATLFDMVGLGFFLEELLGKKVDVVSERTLRSELRNMILAEVVAI